MQTTSAQTVLHQIDPVFDNRSQILILGTIPSPKSRETGFFYGNPQNRFWRVLAALFNEPVPSTIAERTDFLLRHHIALWDVLASCTIEGASDASIANPVANDLSLILENAPIKAVFCTGTKAANLYAKFCEPQTGMPAVTLPSPSPANARARLADLVAAYENTLLPYLEELEPPALDVPDVVALEQTIAAQGTSLEVLMTRAGRALAFKAAQMLEAAPICEDEGGNALAESSAAALKPAEATASPAPKRACILCGNGNNGGDGWVAAQFLSEWGYATTLISTKTAAELTAQPAATCAARANEALQADPLARILITPTGQELTAELAQSNLVIDAILGTGFNGSTVREPYDTWIEASNRALAAGTPTLAADVPSGLSAQTGTASEPCIKATATVTMIVSKTGIAADAAKEDSLCGELSVAPLAYIEPILG